MDFSFVRADGSGGDAGVFSESPWMSARLFVHVGLHD